MSTKGPFSATRQEAGRYRGSLEFSTVMRVEDTVEIVATTPKRSGPGPEGESWGSDAGITDPGLPRKITTSE